METSRYVGMYPPIGGRLLNQNQTTSGTTTNLNGTQPLEKRVMNERPSRHDGSDGTQQQQLGPFHQGDTSDVHTPAQVRRAIQWPSPRANEAELSMVTRKSKPFPLLMYLY